MTNNYEKPVVEIVMLNDIDLISTSGGEGEQKVPVSEQDVNGVSKGRGRSSIFGDE